MTKQWIWISGWAIHPDRFRSAAERALPEDSHQVLAPTPDAMETILKQDVDYIGGYSLGSLILLSSLRQIQERSTIICLAPFIRFCKEDQTGGATPRATLQALQDRLPKQPEQTLRLFYRLAGLDDVLTAGLPYSLEHLKWGLEQLANLQADTDASGRAQAVVGLDDPLINEKEMRYRWPDCHFVDACNHDYDKLLVALSRIENN